MKAPLPEDFEHVPCNTCGHAKATFFIAAQEDLTGKPGDFTFVQCNQCGLVYQNPRLRVDRIIDYYDDEYIAHRRTSSYGLLTPLFNRAMSRLDRRKESICARYVDLQQDSQVLDVGCGAGTFLNLLHRRYGCQVTGVDFKDLTDLPSIQEVDFHCGLYYEQSLPAVGFDLITMWHFLEHDYDPIRSLRTAREHLKDNGRLIIEVPRLDSRTFRWFKNRWPGLQAPQHTVIYSRQTLEAAVEKTGWEVESYLPYGAFPAYFYIFCGLAFTWRKGKGINLRKAILPYFLGQLLTWPMLLFERRLNLAMQTVVCKKPVTGVLKS